MTISYPLSLPDAGFVSVSFRMVSRTGQSTSPFTGESQYYAWPAEWWEADVTLRPRKRADVAEWQAFAANMRGKYGTVLLGDPQATVARGATVGTVLVDGASQTGYTLAVDGLGLSVTNAFRAGDYIHVTEGGLQRLHMVTKDVSSNGSGEATLDIWPALRASPADNASVTYAAAKGVFRMAANEAGWQTDRSEVYSMAFVFRESL